MLRLPICTLFPYTTLFRSEEIALSDRLAHLLEEWRYRDPVLNDFGHHMELFPPASYLYILLGLVPNYQHNTRSEEHTSELQSRPHLVCRLLLEKKKKP